MPGRRRPALATRGDPDQHTVTERATATINTYNAYNAYHAYHEVSMVTAATEELEVALS